MNEMNVTILSCNSVLRGERKNEQQKTNLARLTHKLDTMSITFSLKPNHTQYHYTMSKVVQT